VERAMSTQKRNSLMVAFVLQRTSAGSASRTAGLPVAASRTRPIARRGSHTGASGAVASTVRSSAPSMPAGHQTTCEDAQLGRMRTGLPSPCRPRVGWLANRVGSSPLWPRVARWPCSPLLALHRLSPLLALVAGRVSHRLSPLVALVAGRLPVHLNLGFDTGADLRVALLFSNFLQARLA